LSNPCFELWLVLHRRETSGLSSVQLQSILKEELGAYTKSDYNVEALLRGVSQAVVRAERMDVNPEHAWPRTDGTHVYRLVRKLVVR
jgi:hypothetical protein